MSIIAAKDQVPMKQNIATRQKVTKILFMASPYVLHMLNNNNVLFIAKTNPN